MTERPDLDRLHRLIARAEARRAPVPAWVARALLDWCRECELQLRAGADWRLTAARLGGDDEPSEPSGHW